MICPVHHVDDGYEPVQPPGTMFRACEDLGHAWDVFGKTVTGELRRLVMIALRGK